MSEFLVVCMCVWLCVSVCAYERVCVSVYDFVCLFVRNVTIHKSHDSVHSSVFKSRFCMFFGTVVFII